MEVADQLFVGETSWHLNLSRRSATDSKCGLFHINVAKTLAKVTKNWCLWWLFGSWNWHGKQHPVVTIFIHSVIVTTILVTIILVTERLFFGERWNRWHLVLVLVLVVRKDKAHCGISSTLKAANLRLHWHCVTLYFHIYFFLYLYLSTFSQLSRDTWSFKYLTLVSLSEFVFMLYLY